MSISFSSTLAYQEQTLLNKAKQTGSPRDLIIFYWATRQIDQLKKIQDYFAFSPLDEIYLNLVFLPENPSEATKLAEKITDFNDPWLFYSLTKFFLKSGKLHDALRITAKSLEKCPGNVTCLNLIIKFLSRQGEHEICSRLLNNSLSICPQQADIQALQKQPFSGEIYLELEPRYVEVTFYLPVYKMERYIRTAIEGLFSLNYPIQEVVIVDDGTPDNSIEIAREYPVTILTHPENRGLAAARNTALRYCRTEWLGAIDTDAWPNADYMRDVAVEIEQASDTIAGIGGRLIENQIHSPVDRWRALAMPQNWGDKRICGVEFLYGSNNVFRTAALRHVGGYDEKFRTNAEDCYISETLRYKGYQLVYLPWLVAYHERTDTIPSALKTAWNWFNASKEMIGVFNYLNVCMEMLYLTLSNGMKSFLDLQHYNMHDLLYIQFAYVIHEILAIINTCEKKGTFVKGTFSQCCYQIFEEIQNMDRRFGKNLCEKLRYHLQQIIPLPQKALENWNTNLPDELAKFMHYFKKICQNIPDEIYNRMVEHNNLDDTK